MSSRAGGSSKGRKKAKRAGAANEDLAQLGAKWGLELDPELLVTALTHRSFANEVGGIENNERLEFLGDSVLSIVVTEELFNTKLDAPESELAQLRSASVSKGPLAQVARQLDLGSYVLLGVGESRDGGRDKDSILSDTLEALIGATYLTHGFDKTRAVLLGHMRPILARAHEASATLDWKTPLRELLDAKTPGAITFEASGSGPDHARRHSAKVYMGDTLLGRGSGPSRKRAENAAAEDAYWRIKNEEGSGA